MNDERYPFPTGHGAIADRAQAADLLRAARRAHASDRDELTARVYAMLPDSLPALRLRARSLLADRDHEHAHALIARGLLIAHDDVALMRYRAQALYGLGRHEEAMQEVSRLLRLQPRRVSALILGGRIATAAGRHERAVMWLTRAHLCRPMSERINRLLAEALVEADQGDAALAILNTLPRPMPLLRARALRATGRLCDAADCLRVALHDAMTRQTTSAGATPACAATTDELLAESIIVEELRGEMDEAHRLSRLATPAMPRATIQAASIALSEGAFRRALRLVLPLIRSSAHGCAALAIVVAAAGMLQRNRLASRALRRMRGRRGAVPAPFMHECWRRAMIGSIINDQRTPRRACADPTSSLLQPILKQAAMTLERRLRRHAAADARFDAEHIRKHYELCRDAMTLRADMRYAKPAPSVS